MPAAAARPEELLEYEGQYYSEEIDTTYRIELKGSSLGISRKKYPLTRMEPVFQDAFGIVDFGRLRYGTLRFTRDAERRITGFLVGGDRLRSFRFVRDGVGC
jgi:hypothetical protein